MTWHYIRNESYPSNSIEFLTAKEGSKGFFVELGLAHCHVLRVIVRFHAF